MGSDEVRAQAKHGQARQARVWASSLDASRPSPPFVLRLSATCDAYCKALRMATVSPSSKENVPFHGGYVQSIHPTRRDASHHLLPCLEIQVSNRIWTPNHLLPRSASLLLPTLSLPSPPLPTSSRDSGTMPTNQKARLSSVSSILALTTTIEAEGGADRWARPPLFPINPKRDAISQSCPPHHKPPHSTTPSLPADRYRRFDRTSDWCNNYQNVRCYGGAPALPQPAPPFLQFVSSRRTATVCSLMLPTSFLTSTLQHHEVSRRMTAIRSCTISTSVFPLLRPVGPPDMQTASCSWARCCKSC